MKKLKTIMRLTIVISLFILPSLLHSNNSNSEASTKEAELFGHIVINNEIMKFPQKDSSGNRFVDIDILTNIKHIAIFVDSATIKKHNLYSYRFILSKRDYKKVAWNIYPVKEYAELRGAKTKIKIIAKNRDGETFSENLIIHFPPGIFRSRSSILVYLILAIALIVFFIFVLRYISILKRYRLEKLISTRTEALTLQKTKYEEILTNYMPIEEVNKMYAKDKTTRFKMVTVLFSNVLGFTKIAEQEDAKNLIDDLDRFFFHFDSVVQQFHIEKIKSIGDSYMCAGGIPQKNRTNPIEVVLAAFEMQKYMESLKSQYKAENKKIWDLRMGIHTGPVFSNTNSHKKHLEIWGDTVNIASRMEASGETGKVNITGMTYELVKDYFKCRYLGKMPVKYKGEIDMYIIEGFRLALSEGKGLKPNKAFGVRLGLIRFDDLEEHVMTILENELPKNLHYHNLKHTIDVIVQVEIIGRQENITDEELLLLKTAALFHDCGFTRTYKDHEEMGVTIAKEILPKFDYTEEQIAKIEDLIMVTKLPPEPKDKLEQIMCDADLDYLGRVDFIPVSGNLFRELKEHNIIEDDIDKWNQLQINFISQHQYFTDTAKKLRDVNKNNQLEAIRQLVEEKE